MNKGVKFCGVTHESDIEKAAAAGAKAIGVIVRPDETLDERGEDSRSVSINRACELARATPFNMEFVVAPHTEDYDVIVNIGKSIGPDRLQIAEGQDPNLIEALSEHFKGGATPFLAPVIHVAEDTDPAIIDVYAPHVRFFHLDSPGDRPGGNGEPHDWYKSRELTERAHEHGRLVILSGGLNADNVAEAVRIVRPNGIDAESANRINGVYDLDSMRLFAERALEAVR